MSQFVGIEIGGTKLQIVIGRFNPEANSWNIIDRFRFAVSREEGAAGIRSHIEATLRQIRGRQLEGIGIGFGGPVDRRSGRIACSHQIEGWSEFPITEWIQSLLPLPVAVDNDANVAAYGEALHGAGVGWNPAFYVTMGSGVGGGLVVDGAVYHGALPGEAEIGHVRLDKSGRIVEESCSGWAVDTKIRKAIREGKGGALVDLVKYAGATSGEARFLAAALATNDPMARTILHETADDLAFGLSHVVHLFHPEVIILGGGLSLVGDPLRAAVSQQLDRYVMHAFSPRPKVVLAKLGEDAVPVGALSLALNHRSLQRSRQ